VQCWATNANDTTSKNRLLLLTSLKSFNQRHKTTHIRLPTSSVCWWKFYSARPPSTLYTYVREKLSYCFDTIVQ